jgi:hypothetical protein
MEKGVTSLCGLLREWRMENGDMRVRNRRHVVKPSPRILHSSPAEEKKLGFPFSENGPSGIQGEGATSPFSDLREWEERGVTTPNNHIPFVYQTRERQNPYLATPGHIHDLILKWRTRPYPPVDVQRLAAPIRIHPEIRSGNGESQNFISSHGSIVKTSNR